MKIALLGAGRIGQLHGRLLAGQPGVDDVIVADIDPQRAQAAADAIGGRSADTAEEALDAADAAIVAANTDAHAALISLALDRGLPIFCEKPLALYLVRLIAHDHEPPPDAYIPLSGGLFRDSSIHDFDALRWVTGVEVDEVYAAGSVRGFPIFKQSDD